MPAWVQLILGVAALLTAIGVIWTKGLKPLLIGANRAEEMYRMQERFHTTFKDAPELLTVMREIAKQFRNNDGSSLRDVVDRIDKASTTAFDAAHVLEIQAEVERKLDERDRQQVRRIEVLLDRLERKVDRLEHAAEVVASDLADAHKRADDTQGDPGSAADAASKSDPREPR